MNIPEIIGTLFQSPLLYTVTLIFAIFLLKKGYLSFHSDNLSIGKTRDSERSIIRNQIEYAQSFVKGLLRRMPKDENKYRQLYILEMIYNEITSIISFNHITTSSEYISVKCEKIWNIASTVCDDEVYQTNEFRSLIFEKTEQLIKELDNIRKIGQKNI